MPTTVAIVMNPDSIRAEIKSLIEKYGNDENHLASIDYSDELATVALAADIFGFESFAKFFKIAFALGYEARRKDESDKPLDDDVWKWWD